MSTPYEDDVLAREVVGCNLFLSCLVRARPLQVRRPIGTVFELLLPVAAILLVVVLR